MTKTNNSYSILDQKSPTIFFFLFKNSDLDRIRFNHTIEIVHCTYI